uniref:MICOS complex subunit n=1 Tax=Arion vulgaris TaxID=1028688 RepID=A0A0B6YW55_9EUPU
MATLTRRALRLVAIVGTIPAVGIAAGYRIRSLQAAEAGSSGAHRVYKVYDLPMYQSSESESQQGNLDIAYPRNIIEENIGVIRKSVQDFLGQYEGVYDQVNTTAETGVEHFKSSLDYIQNNPGDLPRVVFIAIAGMGGIVLGYRGGPLRKLTYGSLAAVSCSALCYPKKTVELSHSSVDYVKQLWNENVGEDLVNKYWPFRKDDQSETSQVTPEPETSSDEKTENSQRQPKVKGDIGQSNPADKDLYSTRSS